MEPWSKLHGIPETFSREYGVMNRLEEARNVSGEVSRYYYNGLGHRVGQAVGSIGQNGAAQVMKKGIISNACGIKVHKMDVIKCIL